MLLLEVLTAAGPALIISALLTMTGFFLLLLIMGEVCANLEITERLANVALVGSLASLREKLLVGRLPRFES